MHVLITGGAGFIGSHLVDLHLARGDKVHVVDNLSTGSLDNLAPHLDRPDFRFSEADIVTWPGLNESVGWADRVYHLAAVVGVFRVLERPISVMATNIAGCERLLRAVDHCGWRPQVLLASSSEVYGPRTDAYLREDMDLIIQPEAPPRWNYAISKLADEAFALSYARTKDIPVTVVRLFNTVGPRQTGRYGMVVPRFVRQAVDGEPLTVFGDGTQSRAFTDVRDTVVMLDQLADRATTAGVIVNVGSGNELSMNDLALRVIERVGSASRVERIPYEIAYGQEYVDIPHRCPDLTRLHQLIEHRPHWTLDATLDDLIARARQREGAS
ncbi:MULTISPECIES: NAD-dependent epimerase/dehydratase family protein [unclassified Guyparkeria]|uniref:NAD-dependent epimerase/dehydratase family protein n=1 Tax=unclassified Guyparkeria TaxID=2626246 RepID=UPI0007336E65|nr:MULTISPECIES: NAD-dependent epimerase/dehydratase family protein [unclassified Guyparkeria]KTG17421.1 hypothetical protein AUR63_09775 [Guyparkeria sp. XI15]OAE87398.1 nucleoside-diphosphate sugar epimerase [Guyparkeria sp. WRN-7]